MKLIKLINTNPNISAVNQPGITFIIPTLNSANVIADCLASIRRQRYPSKKIKILIIDGGSTDNTLQIVSRYHVKIISNPFKTAEAGKLIGVKQTNTPLLSFIDSDCILPQANWLKKMVQPFFDRFDIVGTEPLKFTYRPQAGFVERYSALIGANDPYALINGSYDRYSYLTNNWTNLPIASQNRPGYLLLTLNPHTSLPTIGANGTIFQTDFLKPYLPQKYLFDIDIISQILNQTQKPILFAKVKTGIIHTYCESSLSKFIRKQTRRVKDLYFYQKYRHFSWTNQKTLFVLIRENIFFCLYSNFPFVSLFDSIRGYYRQPDIAWFFHPLACFITFWIYTYYSLLAILGFPLSQSRKGWSQ